MDIYILRNFFVSFLGSIFLLVIILVAIDVAEKIDDFIERAVPFDALLIYYQNFIPFYANLLTPLMVFLSVLFFTARLAQRSEIVAFLAGGVSFWRIFLPYLASAGVLTIVSLLFQMFITPHNVRRIEEFEYKFIKSRVYFDKRQLHVKLTREGYFFVRAFDKFDYIGFNAHIERISNSELEERFVAEEIQWLSEKQSWRFLRVWHFQSGQAPRYIPQMDTTLPLAPDDLIRSELYTRTMTLSELWAEYRRQKYVGGEIASLLEIELSERVAIPFATVGLTAIGFASASRKRRGGVALQIGLGLVLAFIYVFLLAIAKSAFSGISGWAWLGAWIPNLIFFPLALFWLWRTPK
ncbi:MAG: LptF/LptG family permease [Bacteroidia bacterium]|nr:LptF/LptG family permease [Bacteroidia bacterium]MCX7651780.1 LptF/LptG family permease [Bacteroidia bacterium]MDW8416348.1 LptF/LptG family permease [Bacteroidia bacterium]